MPEAVSCPLEFIPDLPGLAEAFPQRFPFLLDSADSGPLGRYSLLLRTDGEHLRLDADGRLTGPGDGSSFLDRLRDWYLAEATGTTSNGTQCPFAGGWFIYLGYELAGEIEPVLDLPPATGGLPVALAVRCKGAVVVKHGKQKSAHLVAEDPELLERIRVEAEAATVSRQPSLPALDFIDAEPPERFIAAVHKVLGYLAAGDVFQVNLSRAWHGVLRDHVGTADLYRSLREQNPAPFAGLMLWDGMALMSSSPERLVEIRGKQVDTRPIAGTYPRSEDSGADAELSRSLLAHPKERAEHIMLIDLERNDLGRVCEAGSVEVSELMLVESYAHVHHIVSNVTGTLRNDVTPVDVIRAVFPGGTITGCPKVRCMQIIAELEQKGRGFYTGSMGYIGRDGQMDLNILIRSMLVSGRHVNLRTGAGIVADSRPERELAETEAKALGLLRALGATHG